MGVIRPEPGFFLPDRGRQLEQGLEASSAGKGFEAEDLDPVEGGWG